VFRNHYSGYVCSWEFNVSHLFDTISSVRYKLWQRLASKWVADGILVKKHVKIERDALFITVTTMHYIAVCLDSLEVTLKKKRINKFCKTLTFMIHFHGRRKRKNNVDQLATGRKSSI